MRRYRWRWPTPRPDVWSRLEAECGLSPIVARILCGRGLTTPEAVAAFLSAPRPEDTDPFRLKDMNAAAERVLLAVERNEPVTVYGDYDVDGQAATALLVAFLRRLGARVSYYVPRRVEEGYGLHIPALEQLKAEGRAGLVITADCGATAHAAAREALRLGLDLVITDHHQMGRELPPAAALVNPQRPDCSYPFKQLAGVGVAYKLAQAVWQRAGEPPGCDPAQFLDLVALGTVADVMPLVGENRALVRDGLERLNGLPRVGLRALMDGAGLAGPADAHHLAFVLAPRLNAAGRLDDPTAGVRLLLTGAEVEARELAARLERLNQLRRSLEAFIAEQARAQVEKLAAGELPALVVAGEGWHPGVLGLVASRLVESYYRPTLAVAIEGERARGSGRGVDGFNLHAALGSCADLLDHFGGHEMAAGFSLPAQRLPELRERFAAAAYEQLAVPLAAGELLPCIQVDAEVSLAEIDEALVGEIERLGPFGAGNPAPVLGCRRVRLVESRPVGADGSHLQVRLESLEDGVTLRGIGFRMGEDGARLGPGDWVQAAFTPQLEEWQGRREVRLRLKGLDTVPLQAVRVNGTPGRGSVPGRELRVEDRREGTPAYPGDVARRALLAAELMEQRGPAVLLVLDEAARRDALRVWAEGGARVIPLMEEGRWLEPLGPSPGAWSDWLAGGPEGEQELHVVVACLPPRPGFLAPWFASAPGSLARAVFHLAFGGQDRARSAAALDLFYPSRQELARCYRMWRRVLGEHGLGNPGSGPAPAEARGRGQPPGTPAFAEGPVFMEGIPAPVRRAAFRVFQELGLLREGPGGWALTPPPEGERLDLAASPYYAAGLAARAAFRDWAPRALGADAGEVARSLIVDSRENAEYN